MDLNKIFHKILRRFGVDIIKLSNYPEKSLLGAINFDIHTILDIGANLGQSAQYYRLVCPNAKIHAFEPGKVVYPHLEKWAKTQNGAVETHNIALGNETCMVEFFEHKKFPTNSSILPSTEILDSAFDKEKKQEVVKVNMVRLDDLAETLNLRPGILVKMDVQGFEDRVIAGGQITLQKSKACILEICAQQLYIGQPSFKDIFLLMDEIGFQFAGNISQFFDENGQVAYMDSLFINSKFL